MSQKTRQSTRAVLNRRQFVAASLAGGIGGPFLRLTPAQAADTLKVQLSWTKNIKSAGLFAAAKKGFFREENLVVEFVSGGPQIDPVGGLASGGVDVSIVSAPLSMVAARSRGVPLVAIGSQFAKSPLGLAARADRKIVLPAGLKGAKVGYQQVNRNLLLAILKANGLTDGDITTNIVTGDPTMLMEGRIDLMTVSVLNVPLAMQVRGVEASTWLASDLGVPMQGSIVAVLDSTLKQRRDSLVRFMRAFGRGAMYNMEHPNEVVKFTVEEFGEALNEQHQQAYNKAQIPLMMSEITKKNGLLWLDTSSWKRILEVAADTGVISAPVSLETLLDFSVLEAARLPKV